MKDFVLDSYAVISYLNDEAGSEKVAEIFERCAAEEKLTFLCVINWGEVYYHALRTGGEKKADFALQLIHSLPINIIEANKELTLQAARYKAFHKMSYADAFAAALAKTKKAQLITGDKEFKQLESEIKIIWL